MDWVEGADDLTVSLECKELAMLQVFDELSPESQSKVLNLAMKLRSKEGYGPNYAIVFLHRCNMDNTAIAEILNISVERVNKVLMGVAHRKFRTRYRNLDKLIETQTDIINSAGNAMRKEFLYYSRGNLYKEKGETRKAEADYKEALRLNPDYRDAKIAIENLVHYENSYYDKEVL